MFTVRRIAFIGGVAAGCARADCAKYPEHIMHDHIMPILISVVTDL